MGEQLQLQLPGLVFARKDSDHGPSWWALDSEYHVTTCDHPDKGRGRYYVAWERYPIRIGTADSPEAAQELCREHQKQRAA